jgi:AcrR family transcriptional regulator
MPVGVRAEASRARRSQILRAGLECFLERGVGGTTVDHILERTGASVGSFYHHFASKVEVAAALYLETLESFQRGFLGELLEHPRAQGGIEATVRHFLRWVGERPDLASYLMHCREPEVSEASERRAQELNGLFFAEALAWLERHARRGEVRSLPRAFYYALWMGPADEFARLWLASGRDPALLREAEALLPAAAWEALRTLPRRRKAVDRAQRAR